MIQDYSNQALVASARESFSICYADAREKFVRLAPEVHRYLSPARGPDGVELTTDAAWFGDPNADSVCIIISGVHGAEGYCGSGIQVDWLASGGPNYVPPGQGVLLVHAINPYGFAWDRRVTEEGCDLNRNFIDFQQGVPINPGYEALADALVPRSIEGEVLKEAETAIAAFREAHGELAFQVARKAGQYTHPEGVFFGGFEPTNARRVLENIATDFRLAERSFLTVIDVHTGLGPFGYGEAQSEHAPASESHAIACSMFGQSVTSPDLGTSYSIPLHGTLQSFWERLAGDGRYVYLCLEFGTYDPEAGRRALREDHWLHAYGGGDRISEPGRQIRSNLRRQYYPDTEDWKEMVLFRGRQVIRQALQGTKNLMEARMQGRDRG